MRDEIGFGQGRFRRFAGAVAAGALGVTLGIAAPARAATWTPIQEMTAPGWSGSDWPSVAVDRDGDTLLVWTACDESQPGCYHRAQARIAPAGGGPAGPILTLSPPGASASWPEAGVDDDGDATVVWAQDGVVTGRRISSTGAPGTARSFSGPHAGMPVIAVDPSGLALVVWSERVGQAYAVHARHFDAGGTLGPLLTLGASSADTPAVAVDRAGGAVVVWTPPGNREVVARRIRPDAVSDAVTVAPPVAGSTYGMVSAAADRDGDAVLGYRQASDDAPSGLRVRRLDSAGALGPVLPVSPPGHDVTYYSSLASDLDGDAVVAWSTHTYGVMADVYARTVPRAGALGAVTAFGQGDRPRVALDDDGDGLVAWSAPGPSWAFMGVSAAGVSRDGVFGAAGQVAAEGKVVRVASSPAGRFSLIWQCAPYPYRIQARFGA